MSFETFVETHGPSLMRLAYVLTGDHHQAQDLTQEALATAYRHWGRVEAARSPEAYARRILVNTHLSWRRRLWTREQPREVTEADVPSGAATGARASGEAFDDRVLQRQVLWEAVGRLSLRARTVLVLRYWVGMSDAQIAQELGVRPGTVRSLMSRSLASLRDTVDVDGALAPAATDEPDVVAETERPAGRAG